MKWIAVLVVFKHDDETAYIIVQPILKLWLAKWLTNVSCHSKPYNYSASEDHWPVIRVVPVVRSVGAIKNGLDNNYWTGVPAPATGITQNYTVASLALMDGRSGGGFIHKHTQRNVVLVPAARHVIVCNNKVYTCVSVICAAVFPSFSPLFVFLTLERHPYGSPSWCRRSVLRCPS